MLPRRGRKPKPQTCDDLDTAAPGCIMGGTSPLACAVHRGQVEAAKELLALGASLQPDWGTYRRCPVEVLIEEALERGHAGMAQVLVEAMKVRACARGAACCSLLVRPCVNTSCMAWRASNAAAAYMFMCASAGKGYVHGTTMVCDSDVLVTPDHPAQGASSCSK